MSEDPPTRQLVVFSLGDEEYALPIADVHEIIRYSEPRSVASSVGWIRGVISLRGKIVPVYDLSTRLGQAGEHPGEHHKIVIVETDDAMAGIIVDEVTEVLTIDCEQIETVPVGTEESIESIARVEDRLIVLLDAAGLFGNRVGAAGAAQLAV
jgi:purine-binding chemotaxis protein CheW